jgi:hypothetical protein
MLSKRITDNETTLKAIGLLLKHFEKEENKSLIKVNTNKCLGICRHKSTELTIDILDDFMSQYGLTFMEGLGSVGIVLLTFSDYLTGHQVSITYWAYYSYDINNDKYLVYLVDNDEPVSMTYKQLNLLNHGTKINGNSVDINGYHAVIVKKHMLDIKDVFHYHLDAIQFDKQLYTKLNLFRLAWAQKDDDYIEFLGSNLLGVHKVSFSDNDDNMLLIDILKVDKNILKTDLFNLPGIDPNWKISSNTTYLTLVYLMHGFIVGSLDNKTKEEALRECYYIFAYKVMGSLISHYFNYMDIATAKAVFERLSNRYLIKKYGTWQGVFEFRANDILFGGIHYNRIKDLTTDDATRVIADLQGRLRELVKNIYAELVEVRNSNEKIHSTSMIESNDEGESIRENSVRPDLYINYVRSVFNTPNDFINDDLVYLIATINPKLDVDKFVDTLKYLSNNIKPKINDKDDIIEHTINTTITYLRTKNIVSDYNANAYNILVLMKGYWSSSSVKDPIVKHLKDYIFNIAKIATKKKTTWLLASITISVLLYIFLRSLYKNKK